MKKWEEEEEKEDTNLLAGGMFDSLDSVWIHVIAINTRASFNPHLLLLLRVKCDQVCNCTIPWSTRVIATLERRVRGGQGELERELHCYPLVFSPYSLTPLLP